MLSELYVALTIEEGINAIWNRCVNLRSASSEHADSEDWVDFINKMKDGIMTSFDAQVQQYQDDTRRLDLQRQMPGWNYCTFFILKVYSGLMISMNHYFSILNRTLGRAGSYV
jgi:hypothetical protein